MTNKLFLALFLIISMPCSGNSFIDAIKDELPQSIDFDSLKLDKWMMPSGKYSNNKKYYALYNRINHDKGIIVRLFNSETGKLEKSLIRPELKELTSTVNIYFNKDNNLIALGGMFGSVIIWNLEEDTLIKSCHDGMGAAVKSFSNQGKIVYITTNDGAQKLCSTTSNYVYLSTWTGISFMQTVLTNENKLLTIYPDKFSPVSEDDPFAFNFSKILDPNSASKDKMRERIDIWELNKGKENGFKRNAYIDPNNKNFMYFEFYPTKTLFEQWNYKTKSLIYKKQLPLLKYKYRPFITTNFSENKVVIKGTHEKFLIINDKTNLKINLQKLDK